MRGDERQRMVETVRELLLRGLQLREAVQRRRAECLMRRVRLEIAVATLTDLGFERTLADCT